MGSYLSQYFAPVEEISMSGPEVVVYRFQPGTQLVVHRVDPTWTSGGYLTLVCLGPGMDEPVKVFRVDYDGGREPPLAQQGVWSNVAQITLAVERVLDVVYQRVMLEVWGDKSRAYEVALLRGCRFAVVNEQ